MKKSIIALLIIFVCSLLYGCGGKDSYKSEVIKTSDYIAKYVNEKKKNDFLKYIDKNNKNFYTEESHWFDDLLTNGIKDFSMKVTDFKSFEGKRCIAVINESYKVGQAEKNFSFEAVFIKNGFSYKFSDINFEKVETKYFSIKYVPSIKDKVKVYTAYVDGAVDILKKSYKSIPNEKIELKLYDDNDVFAGFIKTSVDITFAWSELGESIKQNLHNEKEENLRDESKKVSRQAALAHEITHFISFKESNNNIPYWMTEGLAKYVQSQGVLSLNKPSIKLSELEKKNLEKLDSNYTGDKYYSDSYAFVSLFIQKYGFDKLHELILKMGKHSGSNKTAAEIIEQSNKIFQDVLKGEMKLSIDELEAELIKEVKVSSLKKKEPVGSIIGKPQPFTSETNKRLEEIFLTEATKMNHDEYKFVEFEGAKIRIRNYNPLSNLEDIKKYYPYMKFPDSISGYKFKNMSAWENCVETYYKGANENVPVDKILKRDLSRENVRNVQLVYINADKVLSLEVMYIDNTGSNFASVSDKRVKSEQVEGQEGVFSIKEKESGNLLGVKKDIIVDQNKYAVGLFISDSKNNACGTDKEYYELFRNINLEELIKNVGI